MAILIALLALCLATSSGAQPISAESAQYHDLDAGELVAEGNVEVLSHLVALKEVDPNRRTRTGSTLLCVAVEQGNSEIAALLLQAGANVETRDSKTGHTPLCIAALAKNTEMAKLLLSYGASPDDRSASGRSPRIIANEEKDVELLKVIEVFDQSGAAAFEDPPGTWLAFSEGNHRYYQVSLRVKEYLCFLSLCPSLTAWLLTRTHFSERPDTRVEVGDAALLRVEQAEKPRRTLRLLQQRYGAGHVGSA